MLDCWAQGRAPGRLCRGGRRVVRPASSRLSPAQPCKRWTSCCSLSGPCPDSPIAWSSSLCPALRVWPRTLMARPEVQPRGSPPDVAAGSSVSAELLCPRGPRASPPLPSRSSPTPAPPRSQPETGCLGRQMDGRTRGGPPALGPRCQPRGFSVKGNCLHDPNTLSDCSPNVTAVLFHHQRQERLAPCTLTDSYFKRCCQTAAKQ